MQYFRSVLYACFLLFLVGCSTTKDKWVNRKYHETTAHCNAYFNGLEAFNDGVRTFEEKEKLNLIKEKALKEKSGIEKRQK